MLAPAFKPNIMNNSTKYIIATLIVLVGVVGISFYSCEKEEITPNETTVIPIQEMDEDNISREEGTAEVRFEVIGLIEPYLNANYDFKALNEMCGKATEKAVSVDKYGQVGRAKIYNSNNFLNVLIVSNDAYKIEAAKLMIRPATASIPKEADYESFSIMTPADREPTRFAGFKIPAEDVSKDSFIAGAVKMVGADGKRFVAWIEGEVYGSTLLGKRFSYTLQECTVPADLGDYPAPPTDGSENIER